MKKRKIQEIISLSSFIMVDPEYTRFITYVKNLDFTSARLFLDNLMSKIHDSLGETENSEQIIDQYRRCNKLEDLILDLIMSTEKTNDKTKRVRQRIIR